MALVDIEAGTVLAWDGAVKLPQEEIDALGGTAALVLGDGAGRAILARPTGTHVFVRAPGGTSEVLCSLFAPGAPLDGVTEESRRVLSPDAAEEMA
ncbi:hypothetical protein [Pseudooceanicola sp. LIPI14-2-Ac024]|uniref:hypothetical protein n=1 Tax=Pseudooceanicola sp. LIPI14-2-Ac024 TaxID=3344875 RepID=UPI0035CF4A90